MWLVMHGAILTNLQRVQRHMVESDNCEVCSGCSETWIHLLRDFLKLEYYGMSYLVTILGLILQFGSQNFAVGES